MRILLIALLLSSALHAGYEAAYDSNLSAVMVRINAQVDGNGSTDDFLAAHSLSVVGSDIDLGERLLFESIRLENQWFSKVRSANDSVDTLHGIEGGPYSLVILLGGPAQNNITRIAVERGWFNETYRVEGGFIIETGRVGNGTLILSISGKKGYFERPDAGLAFSPLNGIIPKEYIPAAATGISLALIALLNVVRTVYEFKALDIGRKGRKIGEGAYFYRGINMTEIGAITAASVVLGMSISWQYFGPSAEFLKWLLINSAICFFAAISHEITHRIFAHLFKIKVEYRLWPAGSALTLVSSYLGNAFSAQGFVLEEIDPQTPKWKVGLMKLSAPLVSAAIMVVFAIINYNSPDIISQTVYATSGLWAVVEILPLGSLDGKDIKEWSHTIWFIAFTLISAAYVIVTFLI